MALLVTGDLQSTFQTALAISGFTIILAFIGNTIYYCAKNVFVFFLAYRFGLTVDFKGLGEWAVVTGATDGIGKGYALELARRGCNIILVSRTDEKLKRVAKEIEMEHNVRTKIIVADFTADENKIYEKIEAELVGLEIGTLVNNVGMTYLYPEYLHEMPGGQESDLVKIIRCNCIAQTMMTRIVLPQMVARGKGAVINLSSAAGAIPIPFLAVYSATKAYNDFFGRALQVEYQDKGIIIQVVMPYFVATNMSAMRDTSMFVLNAADYARSCLNTVGFFGRTNGHPAHAFQNWITTNAPSFVKKYLVLGLVTTLRKAQMADIKSKEQ